MKKIAILGGGISGLAAAWYLRALNSSCHISLLEEADRLGGWIQTIEKPIHFERGPRALRALDSDSLALIDALDLKKELISASAYARRRYILLHEKLHAINPHFFVKQGFLGACLKEFFRPKVSYEESIDGFFRRRFGDRVADYLIDPIVRGIFAGDAKRLSMNACMPRVASWQERYRSVITGALLHHKRKIPPLSFQRGMHRLPMRLYESLKDHIEIHLNCPALKITTGKQIVIDTPKGSIEADVIISALPAFVLEKILAPDDFLSSIGYQTVTMASLAFQEECLPHRGFGFLVPSLEDPSFLGMSFDSDIFIEHNREAGTRCTLMFKGPISNGLDQSRSYLERLFGIVHSPIASDLYIAKQAVPQFSLGHLQRLKTQCHPQILLTGNYLYGVSIAHSVASAKAAAQKASLL